MRNQKVFVVSNNKCGTSSLKAFLGEVGLRVARQAVAERLYFDQLMDRDSRVTSSHWVNYISSSDAFQDVPFSTSKFLPWLVTHYPDALYIHVSREADDWYRSLIDHHIARRLSMLPELDSAGSLVWSRKIEMASASRPYRGIPLHALVAARFGTPITDPYQKAVLSAYHQFQQEQAGLLLRHRDSVLCSLGQLMSDATAEEIRAHLGTESVVPIPHRNAGMQ